jgi:hypothetical protein
MFYSQRTYVKNDVTKVTVFSHRVEGGQQLCLVDVVGELQLEFGLVLGVVSHFPGLSGMTWKTTVAFLVTVSADEPQGRADCTKSTGSDDLPHGCERFKVEIDAKLIIRPRELHNDSVFGTRPGDNNVKNNQEADDDLAAS